MKKKLTGRELIFISSMLFGMFFGAGNLIFPASMGMASGKNFIFAYVGMFMTAVGLPLLAVASLGISKSNSLPDMAKKAGSSFAICFSTILYLTIGPLFAVPRCAGTSFSIGTVGLGDNVDQTIALAVFSVLFFLAVLVFSLQPGNIMTWIGKILNPIFLVLLFGLIIAALLHPVQMFSASEPVQSYATANQALFTGFLEGYNTLDALSGLAFGIVIVNEVKRIGITDPGNIATATIHSGVFSCLAMGVVYFLISLISAQSASVCGECTNGSEILGVIADHYFGKAGTLLLFAIVTMACLKTAVGLVTSCAEAFIQMFPGGPGYRCWTYIFIVISAAVANLGLTSIVDYCVPLLMLLYPIAMVLILLSLAGRFFENNRIVYIAAIFATSIAALLDFLNSISQLLDKSSAGYQFITRITALAEK